MFVRRVALAALLTRFTTSSPFAAPQGLDFDVVDNLPPASTVVIPIGVASQIVTVNEASAIASVAALATKAPLTDAYDGVVSVPAAVNIVTASYLSKRQAGSSSGSATSSCTGGTPQATGTGPASTPDTPAGFQQNGAYGSSARSAAVPSGYTQTFSNLNGSSQAYGYLGFTSVTSYDPASCASKCNSIQGCQSFNIFFERDPSVDPGSGTNCNNPSSTTLIKCSFWGSPIDAVTATNTGQYRANFQVLIAGSNGYVNYNPPTAPSGYTTPQFLNNASINAPLDCNGASTYMGVRMFNSGPFDVNLCAAACTATSQADIANPPRDGSPPMLCNFFVTYLLLKNGVVLGQYCALYNETWSNSYATNFGQYDQSGNHYTIMDSYSSSNSTNPGICQPLPTCGAQHCRSLPASSMLASASADCSSYLLQTATAALVTSTFTGSTIVSTNTVLTTKTVPGPTVTAVTTYNLLKRDDPAFTMVTTHGIHLFPVNQRLKARDSTVRQLPTYASVCAALQYISACSCLGVTASTTTLSGLTTYVTVIPSTTTIVTSTTTATAQGSTFVTATTVFPTCTAFQGPVVTIPGATASYTRYFAGRAVTEAANNPGNDQSGYPPITTTIAVSSGACGAANACATFAANGNNVYDSYDLHLLIAENVYQCVAYYDPNSDPAYFNQANADVGGSFGFNIQFLQI